MSTKPNLADLIDHIVIIVKENHTFDNYFGTFPGAEGTNLQHAANPPPDDPNHRHETWEQRASDQKHKVQYVENDIPAYFALARQYTLCDHYFSEVAGPSTPKHLMLICADAPIINNPHHHYRPSPKDSYKLHSMPMALERAGMTWLTTAAMFVHHAAAGQLPAVS